MANFLKTYCRTRVIDKQIFRLPMAQYSLSFDYEEDVEGGDVVKGTMEKDARMLAFRTAECYDWPKHPFIRD